MLCHSTVWNQALCHSSFTPWRTVIYSSLRNPIFDVIVGPFLRAVFELYKDKSYRRKFLVAGFPHLLIFLIFSGLWIFDVPNYSLHRYRTCQYHGIFWKISSRNWKLSYDAYDDAYPIEAYAGISINLAGTINSGEVFDQSKICFEPLSVNLG